MVLNACILYPVFRSKKLVFILTASIKSSTDQPLSAPTPGQAHTPVQAHTPGMARTPGAPNTPGAARTPGAPQTPSNTPGTAHTPGMAHTPGKAPTPSSLSLTPGGMAHTPMVPHTPASIPPPSSSVVTTQQLPRRPSNHIAYATHFPIPQDEMSTHECNQRLVVLYGVGKAREEARLIAKKANKENGKLFAKKNRFVAARFPGQTRFKYSITDGQFWLTFCGFILVFFI